MKINIPTKTYHVIFSPNGIQSKKIIVKRKDPEYRLIVEDAMNTREYKQWTKNNKITKRPPVQVDIQKA